MRFRPGSNTLTGVRPIAYQPVGMAQPAISAWPPAISREPGGAGDRGVARRGIASAIRQAAEKSPTRRKAIHINAVTRAEMQGNGALFWQPKMGGNLGKVLVMRRVIAGGNKPALPPP